MIDDIQRISRELKKNIQQVDREDVEQSDVIIKAAQRSETALLVIGDALTATTHNQIRFELEDLGIPVLIYENASIVTAILWIFSECRLSWNLTCTAPRIYYRIFLTVGPWNSRLDL